jgi:3-methylfumaryl-CoA hydratase
MQHLRDWIGRSETRVDDATAAPVASLSATLDRDDPQPLAGSDVPPLAHWLYFTPQVRQSQIGPDGHARRGDFLPPVPLPRRMWAGGRLEFRHPLRIGDELVRVSRIADVTIKEGRSGALVFVTVRHAISNAFGIAVTEEHDIVYRDAPSAQAPPPPPQPAPVDETFSRLMTPDPVLLFRYSALTFNGHRIHYDRNYVTQVEGYPGLIVHGPLIATLLLDLLRREVPDARVSRFGFKAFRPVFDIHTFTVCGRIETGQDEGGRRVQLWARDHEGGLAMQATADID